MLTSKKNKKRVQAINFDEEDKFEDESSNFPADKNLSDSKDENSSESNGECLQIRSEEEISIRILSFAL